MLRPPPRSPLFPYTTLFRSVERPVVFAAAVEYHADANFSRRILGVTGLAAAGCCESQRRQRRGQRECQRSEEHTSELQSRQYLVCRLLLEKKKKKKIIA